jgi:hypothetical protein
MILQLMAMQVAKRVYSLAQEQHHQSADSCIRVNNSGSYKKKPRLLAEFKIGCGGGICTRDPAAAGL